MQWDMLKLAMGKMMMTEEWVEAELAKKSKKPIENFKRWKTMIIFVIVFIMLY